MSSFRSLRHATSNVARSIEENSTSRPCSDTLSPLRFFKYSDWHRGIDSEIDNNRNTLLLDDVTAVINIVATGLVVKVALGIPEVKKQFLARAYMLGRPDQ
jgi:hypothetical protein